MTAPAPARDQPFGATIPGSWFDRHRSISVWLLASVVGLGLALRYYRLDTKSLWLDESFSLWMIRQPWDDFWRYASDLDLHPPLYYLVLRGWSALAGDSETALRLPSLVCSVATLPVVFGIGLAIGGRALGLLSALLLAVSPLHISFAQQTRMYALSTLLGAAAVLCVVHLLVDDRTRPGAAEDTPFGRLRGVVTPWWLGFVVCTSLLVYCHNVAVLFVLAIGVFLIEAWLTEVGEQHDAHARAKRGDVALGLGAVVLLWLPWLPAFSGQAVKVDDDFWIKAPTLVRVLSYWREIVGGDLGEPSPVLVGLALGLLALAGVGAWRLRGRSAPTLLLVLVVLVPLVAELLISITRQPIFYTRTILWSTPPFYVLLASGLLAARFRTLVVAATAAAVLYMGWSLPEYYQWVGQEDWRAAAELLAAEAQPGDVVLVSPGWTQLAFDYYYEQQMPRPPVREYGLPVTLFERSVLEPKMLLNDSGRVDKLIAGARRVWLLHSHADWADPGYLAPTHLARVSHQVGDPRIFQNVRVYLFELPGR